MLVIVRNAAFPVWELEAKPACATDPKYLALQVVLSLFMIKTRFVCFVKIITLFFWLICFFHNLLYHGSS